MDWPLGSKRALNLFFEMKHGKEDVLNDVQNNIQSSTFR